MRRLLYSERKREQERLAAEAEGESFWTKSFSAQVRVKIWHAFTDAGPTQGSAMEARNILLRSEGLMALAGTSLPVDDLHRWTVTECPQDRIPNVIEAMYRSLPPLLDDLFVEEVQNILYLDRVAYQMIEGRVEAFESMELHEEVVAPVLRLLSGRSGYKDVEDAYQDALREVASGEPADAITDAARALEQVLVVRGCEGNSLGPRLQDARKKGLLAAHDGGLTSKVAEWVSADRSERGDAHTAPTTSRDDAWFAIHIVGALILRLVGEPRGGV